MRPAAFLTISTKLSFPGQDPRFANGGPWRPVMGSDTGEGKALSVGGGQPEVLFCPFSYKRGAKI